MWVWDVVWQAVAVMEVGVAVDLAVKQHHELY